LKAERALARHEAEQLDLLGEVCGERVIAERDAKTGGGLRQTAEATADTPERRLARRVIASFAMQGRESTRALFDQQDYEAVANLLEVVTSAPSRATADPV